eukprot:CAMPEP_0202915126 /NCGR_PEP_ID=MMETSP1392-20130828/64881_1 /ASSEMBLY_ACC=CAM_ASM_000868 /TAXON_ID=225041 /ORGANISM="Chlamydomonas chlamydogama, Strain SAG 11-48b" /LENGTH=65 /DNA_ID=CAMNT_0049607027 /DNA_START=92 /DNA_END=289 /DNA_ORIENTATION=+
MDPQEKEKIAQERYGKSFEELSTNEQKAVGGVKGGAARGGHSADPEHAPPPPEVKFGEDNPAPSD